MLRNFEKFDADGAPNALGENKRSADFGRFAKKRTLK